MGARAKTAIGAILLTISAFLIPYGFQLHSNWNKLMKGEIVPFEVNDQELFVVQMGGIHSYITIDQLSKGYDLKDDVYLNGIDYPFQVSFADGKILVSAEIRNADGDLVATIAKNNWGVSDNPVVAYDRNYNSYAFEVKAPNQVPILQVAMTPQNRVFIGGVFYSVNGTILAMINGTTFLNPRENVITDYDQTIFQYPSVSHLGELAPNSPFDFGPTQPYFSPIWVIGIGLVLFFMGTCIIGAEIRDKVKGKKATRARGRTKRPKKRGKTRRVRRKEGTKF